MKLDQGRYAVQLEWIVDIATPAYTQLMKISGAENENESVAAFPEPRFQASWEPKKKRVLKFEMNDGTRSVYGMEWKPIKKLHDKVPPGMKLLIVGPVNIVRGGTLFLSDENIQVIGGDADSMGGGGGGVDPLSALLGSRLNLRGDELRKRFPNLGKGGVNKVEPLDDVTNNTPVAPVVAENRRASVGGGGISGVGCVNEIKNEQKPQVKVEARTSSAAKSTARSSNSSAASTSSNSRPFAVKSEPPAGSSSSSRPLKTSQKPAVQIAERESSSSSSSRPLKTSQKPAIKTETLFQPPTSPAPSTSKGRSNSVSSTPPTPAHHRAVLNDLFGVSQTQSPPLPQSTAKLGDDFGDDFDDDFDGDDDLFEKLEAIEQEAATDSQQPHQPHIETTLNYHPSTQQVVSTSVKLHNFSGELDISHHGGIKVSASPCPASPGKLQAMAKSVSRGMAFTNAAVNAAKSAVKTTDLPSSGSSAADADGGTSSTVTRPWTPNQHPRAFQHDPLFSEEEGDLNLSQLKNTSPLKAKRKSEGTPSDGTAKRVKTESKKQVATVRPSVSEPPITKPIIANKQPSVSGLFSLANQSADQHPSTSHSSSTSPLVKKENSKLVGTVDLQFDAFDSDELDWEGNGKDKEVVKPAFRYLNEFAEWSSRNDGENSDPFLAKCFIATFLGKFRSDEKAGFHIDVKITDGVSTFGVRISDSVCVGFLRFTASEYLNWKRDKERHREKLASASKRLVEFNLMLLHVSGLFRLEKLPRTTSVDHLDAVVVELREFGLEDFIRLHKNVGRARK